MTTWLERANAAGVYGFVHPCELERLVNIATGKDVLEIGSFKGLSAWCMAHTAKSVTCVDTFKANDAGQTQLGCFTTFDEFLRNVERFDNVRYFIGSSKTAARRVKGVFDVVFLDAMHTYDDVKDDIKRWWSRLKVGGVLAVHDYGHDDFPGVKQAVDERFGDLGPYNPPMDNWVVTLRTVTK